MATHTYELDLAWAGDQGVGTTGYRDYTRDVRATSDGRPVLELSADKPFRGDPARWNPELLLLAALGECHLLSFLHMAVRHGVTVTSYRDSLQGWLEQEGLGGRFTRVLLRPRVTVTEAAHVDLVPGLHHEAAQACFIASSVNFPIEHDPFTAIGRNTP